MSERSQAEDGPGGTPEDGSGDGERIPTAVVVEALRKANQMVTITDEGGVIVYANDGFGAYGYEPDDIVGAQPLDFVHPDDLERAVAGVSILDRTAASVPMPFRLRRADGRYDVVHVGSTLLEVEGRRWMAFDMTPIPFHVTTEQTLAALGEGASPESALDVLATGLTEVLDLGLIVGIAFDGPDGRSVVGPLDPELAEVDGHTYDTLPADLRARADERGLAALTVLPVPDPGWPHPATLVVWYRDPTLKEVIDLFLAALPSDIIRIALAGRHQREELERHARSDGLTGLANRRAFFARLDDRPTDRVEPRSVALLYVDLDDFKPVNDLHGHDVGDHVLQEVARRFHACVRPHDLVARLGGDEFAVICEGLDGPDHAAAVGRRLLEAASGPVRTTVGSVSVGATVGVAYVADGTTEDLQALLNAADDALLRAKRSRKGTVELTTAARPRPGGRPAPRP